MSNSSALNFIRRRSSRSTRGQSLVEMALILPFLLGFAGAATDFARAYQASISLESSVRNAAEYVALNSADSTTAIADALRVVCLESTTIPGFQTGSGPDPDAACLAPNVSVPTFDVSTTSPGATVKYPIGTAVVEASVQFDTLLPYPFLPEGGWTLSADATYSVVRGR